MSGPEEGSNPILVVDNINSHEQDSADTNIINETNEQINLLDKTLEGI